MDEDTNYSDTPLSFFGKPKRRVTPKAIRNVWEIYETLRHSYLRIEWGMLSKAEVESLISSIIELLPQAFLSQHSAKELTFKYFYEHSAYIFAQIIADFEYDEPLVEGISHDFFAYYGGFFDYSYLRNARNLYAYLVFRTKVRHFEYAEVPLAFVYLYIFELIHLIGAQDAEDAFKRLLWLREHYGIRYHYDEDGATTEYQIGGHGDFAPYEYTSEVQSAHQFTCHIVDWLRDFTIYYNLEPYCETIKSSNSWEFYHRQLLNSLDEPSQLSDDELVSVLFDFAGNQTRSSIYRKQNTADFDAILVRFYRTLDAQCRQERNTSLVAAHLSYGSCLHKYFHNIEFFPEECPPSCLGRPPIQLDRFHIARVAAVGARPTIRRDYQYYYYIEPGKEDSIKLAQDEYMLIARRVYGAVDYVRALLKCVDYTLREITHFRSKIKRPDILDDVKETLMKIIQDYHQDKQRQLYQQRLNSIKIDASDIAIIRQDAEKTKSSLLTESEIDVSSASPAATAFSSVPSPAPEATPALNLTHDERELLRRLISNESVANFLTEHHLQGELLVDSINGKLYDSLLDNALSIDGNEIMLYNEYTAKVKSLLENAT